MPNKNYERGRASEYRTQRELEALGYQTTRTAGSHGAADVIAWNECHTRYVQCKTYLKRTGTYTDDLKKMSLMILPPNSQVELWVRKIGQKGWQTQSITRLRIGSNATLNGRTTDGSTSNIATVSGTLVSKGLSVVSYATPQQAPSGDASKH